MNADYITNPTLSVRWRLSHHTAIMTVTAVPGSDCSYFPLYMNIISLYP